MTLLEGELPNPLARIRFENAATKAVALWAVKHPKFDEPCMTILTGGSFITLSPLELAREVALKTDIGRIHLNTLWQLGEPRDVATEREKQNGIHRFLKSKIGRWTFIKRMENISPDQNPFLK